MSTENTKISFVLSSEDSDDTAKTSFSMNCNKSSSELRYSSDERRKHEKVFCSVEGGFR